jgi:hypothetical protein
MRWRNAIELIERTMTATRSPGLIATEIIKDSPCGRSARRCEDRGGKERVKEKEKERNVGGYGD